MQYSPRRLVCDSLVTDDEFGGTKKDDVQLCSDVSSCSQTIDLFIRSRVIVLRIILIHRILRILARRY